MKFPHTSAALSLLAFILVAACNAPKSLQIASPMALDQAFDCAVREVNRAGYTVQDANREAGFIAAERAEGGTNVLTGDQYFSILRISTYEEDGATRLRLTLSRQADSGGQRKTIRVQGQIERDAAQLLQACGDGEIREVAVR